MALEDTTGWVLNENDGILLLLYLNGICPEGKWIIRHCTTCEPRHYFAINTVNQRNILSFQEAGELEGELTHE